MAELHNCTNCVYSRTRPLQEGNKEKYACHRSPPQLFLIDGKVKQLLPEVTAEDWCGEWYK